MDFDANRFYVLNALAINNRFGNKLAYFGQDMENGKMRGWASDKEFDDYVYRLKVLGVEFKRSINLSRLDAGEMGAKEAYLFNFTLTENHLLNEDLEFSTQVANAFGYELEKGEIVYAKAIFG